MENLKGKKMYIPMIIAIITIIIGIVIMGLNIMKNEKLQLKIEDTMRKGITFDRIIPMNDVQGLGTKEYIFSVINSSNKNKKYKIYLDDVKISGRKRMNDSNIRYSITKNGSEENPKELTDIGKNPNRILDSATISGGRTNIYTLKVWFKKEMSNDDMTNIFKTKLRLEEIEN